ncbi:methanol:corrinoid methyltransferase [Caldanaerobius fijiensis DSM 17918]|uniref:Methanol:corrinoid methyltransferase n=1 Tax=Caldanaerobius fijiensis DSM 17918 TaxID=1121256 RepID=A0A1M5FGP0_9THEO|nr:methyltransferase MtaB domain-containing protein [Caldanaerobius fijiensis]SHF90656.1 methanol:corrinoid methyltransferase [Caldanaerobius fijiensis DSM 17918]
MRKRFTALTYSSIDDFVYGNAAKPLKMKNGMVIGGGTVYPEINFTLPPMNINKDTMPEVRKQYHEMIEGVLKRAVELHAPGIVVEIELLPDMTAVPEWGIEVCKIVRERMYEYEQKLGLKSLMRITPNDNRDMIRPPKMRAGLYVENMYKTFEGCAKAGADFLAIESTGGKEVNDDALLNADLKKVLFSLGVLGSRDMEYLWGKIVDIANETGTLAAGDSACGFANTAMVLADQGFIPRVFAAIVRVVAVGRSLVAYEMGAVGPSKDCAYEGPYIKAIAGIPIVMEGKSSAGAHLSPVGNIAAAVADLWSNESIPNIKLLSDMAPTVSMEQLIYDCRLMNKAAAISREDALRLRDWLTDSDSFLDPQAYILRPDVVLKISGEIIKGQNDLERAKIGAYAAIKELKKAVEEKKVSVPERELKWLDIMEAQVEETPDDEEELWYQLKDEIDPSKFIAEEYGIK